MTPPSQEERPMAADAIILLFSAIRRGDASDVEAMLDASPLLATARHDNVSAVLWSCYVHQAPVTRIIRNRLSTVDVFEACALGEADVVASLLARDPALANAVAADGFGPLGLACFFGREPVVRLLLAAGARIDAASANAMRVMPLHSAAAARSVPICRLLLAAGAPVNARQGGELGFTPLMEAALNGDTGLAELLMANGADVTMAGDDGKRAADHAREAGHHALADRLSM
jgi:ankyrin repeat protein